MVDVVHLGLPLKVTELFQHISFLLFILCNHASQLGNNNSSMPLCCLETQQLELRGATKQESLLLSVFTHGES